jgi:glutaminase
MLSALTQAQLDVWVAQARSKTFYGRLPDYIPLLSQVKPDALAVQVQAMNGDRWQAGDVGQTFALMSVIKPLLLLFALEQHGFDAVFQHVGMKPSELSFHSLQQLHLDQGFPRNPMINSGAITLTRFLTGQSGGTRCEMFRQWLNHHAETQFFVDQKLLASVRSLTNETNRAIAKTLYQHQHLDRVELAIDTYNHLCCLSGTITDLARAGILLTQMSHAATVNALMLTCGLYEASSEFAVRIGIPTKSGVSGALLSVVPGQGAIACYSPAIDAIGNSVAGLGLLEQIAKALNLGLFG